VDPIEYHFKLTLRIIQLISAFHLGGAEVIAGNLASGLAGRGHKVLVASVRQPTIPDIVGERLKVRLSSVGVELRELAIGMRGVDSLLCPIRISSLYRHWHADIIHTHTDVPDLMVSLANRLGGGMRIARTIHNTELWPTHWQLGKLTETGLTDDMVIYTNNATLEAYHLLRRRYSLKTSPLKALIKNGFPAQWTEELYDRSHLAEKYSADSGRVQFCFAGRLAKQKGIDILMNAITELPKSYLARIQIHVFGDGEEKQVVLDAARREPLSIFLHAPEPDMYRLFSAFDCVILPSRHEGLPMVVIESLCLGVPIIVTTAPGLIESVPEWWPLVVPSEDSEALGRLVRSVVDGEFDLSILGRRASSWANEEYALEKMVDQHEEAYKLLMADDE
jgi:glycosyltransferase involved in cell wall biosynthesis